MKGKYMLTSKFKEEALNKLENMSTDELVDSLKFVGSELDTQYLNKLLTGKDFEEEYEE